MTRQISFNYGSTCTHIPDARDEKEMDPLSLGVSNVISCRVLRVPC